MRILPIGKAIREGWRCVLRFRRRRVVTLMRTTALGWILCCCRHPQKASRTTRPWATTMQLSKVPTICGRMIRRVHSRYRRGKEFMIERHGLGQLMACPTTCPPNFVLLPNTCFPAGGGPAGGSCYPIVQPGECGPNQTYVPPGGLLIGPRYGQAGMITPTGGCNDTASSGTTTGTGIPGNVLLIAGIAIGGVLLLVLN